MLMAKTKGRGVETSKQQPVLYMGPGTLVPDKGMMYGLRFQDLGLRVRFRAGGLCVMSGTRRMEQSWDPGSRGGQGVPLT